MKIGTASGTASAEGQLLVESPTFGPGALQPLAAIFPLVSGSLCRVLEIAAISVAVVAIW
jgi:hypothetical protein